MYHFWQNYGDFFYVSMGIYACFLVFFMGINAYIGSRIKEACKLFLIGLHAFLPKNSGKVYSVMIASIRQFNSVHD